MMEEDSLGPPQKKESHFDMMEEDSLRALPQGPQFVLMEEVSCSKRLARKVNAMGDRPHQGQIRSGGIAMVILMKASMSSKRQDIRATVDRFQSFPRILDQQSFQNAQNGKVL